MPKQRDLVRMTEAEIAAFVDERRSLIVATIGKDGAPHLTTLWFAVEDGAYLFETYAKSQKVMNLKRDPRIALMWEAGEVYKELQGVTVNGRAEIVDSEPELTRLMTLLVTRNTPERTGEALVQHVRKMVEKRVVVAVQPEKVVSWDHRKLGL